MLEKAFFVVEAMEKLGVPVTLKRIADEVRMPKATVYRILQSLVSLGYIAQDPATGSYQLTMKLAQLGRVNRYDSLIIRATPYMEKLQATFNETTNLGVLEDSSVYYLHSIETTKPLRWIVKPGASDAFHCTALGRAIVAFLPEEEIGTLVKQIRFEQRTKRTPMDPQTVLRILDKVKEDGWAIDDEENDTGVLCVAVPLLHGQLPVASISISLPKGRLTQELRMNIISSLVEVKEQWTNDEHGIN